MRQPAKIIQGQPSAARASQKHPKPSIASQLELASQSNSLSWLDTWLAERPGWRAGWFSIKSFSGLLRNQTRHTNVQMWCEILMCLIFVCWLSQHLESRRANPKSETHSKTNNNKPTCSHTQSTHLSCCWYVVNGLGKSIDSAGWLAGWRNGWVAKSETFPMVAVGVPILLKTWNSSKQTTSHKHTFGFQISACFKSQWFSFGNKHGQQPAS